MRPRWDRRRYSTPSRAATSPTASNARSSEMISIRSPGRALPSHTPALTAMRRSLQSFTPVDGALCTRWAPRRASSRALSAPITRQFPTAIRSTRRSCRSMARWSRTRLTWSARLEFSTSTKIARRPVGSGGLGAGGLKRAANPRSGVAVRTAGSVLSGSGASTGVGAVAARGRVGFGVGFGVGLRVGFFVCLAARLGLAMSAEPKNRRSRHASQALRHGAAPSPNLRLTTPRDTPITVGTGGPTPWT